MPWIVVCRRTDIPRQRGWPVRVGERRIAIFDDAGELRAVDNECIHAGYPLDDAFVDAGCVACPWHGWRYELRSGDLLTSFGHHSGLVTYPVREKDGDVFVQLD